MNILSIYDWMLSQSINFLQDTQQGNLLYNKTKRRIPSI